MVNSLKPTFIGIGAQKAATSWLAETLKSHPQIYMPRKEIHYFDLHYEKGRDWYMRQFKDAPNTSISIGEFTPKYMYDQEASARLIDQYPDIKLICILRDPVMRAFSQYKFSKHKFNYKHDFREYFYEKNDVKERGMYFKQLSRFSSYLDEGKLLILVFEEVVSNIQTTFEELAQFLGVDVDGFRQVEKRGRSNVARFPLLRSLVCQAGSGLRRRNMHNLAEFGIRFAMPMLRMVLDKKDGTQTLSDDFLKELSGEYWSDINKLESFINRDLSLWPSHPSFHK